MQMIISWRAISSYV